MKKALICLLLAGLTLFQASCGYDGKNSDGYDDDDDGNDDGYDGSGIFNSGVDNTDAPEYGYSSEEYEEIQKEQERIYEIFALAGVDAVTYETGEEYASGQGVSVEVIAQVPNYTEMFQKAFATDDPEQTMIDLIRQKDFSTVEYSGIARYYINEDGEECFDSDLLIEGFVEEELVKAIAAVSADEEANEQ